MDELARIQSLSKLTPKELRLQLVDLEARASALREAGKVLGDDLARELTVVRVAHDLACRRELAERRAIERRALRA